MYNHKTYKTKNSHIADITAGLMLKAYIHERVGGSILVEHITVATLNLVPVLEIEIFFLISFCILKNFYLFLAALGLLWFMWAFSNCKKKS